MSLRFVTVLMSIIAIANFVLFLSPITLLTVLLGLLTQAITIVLSRRCWHCIKNGVLNDLADPLLPLVHRDSPRCAPAAQDLRSRRRSV